jgi:hypothetical protein
VRQIISQATSLILRALKVYWTVNATVVVCDTGFALEPVAVIVTVLVPTGVPGLPVGGL